MASAKGIIAKLDSALRKVNVTDRSVYKRVTTRSGGDSLIGRPGSVDYTDTLLSPPPMYQRLERNVVGNHVTAQRVMATDGTIDQIAVDYSIVLSPSSITRYELSNPDVSLVFKDTSGNEEVFRITDYEAQPFQGSDLQYTAFLRSAKRPAK